MDDGAGGAVAGVEHHLDAAAELELRRELVQIGGDDVHRMLRAMAGGEVAGFDQTANFLNGVTMQRTGAAHGFEAIELAGIVAAGDHNGTVGFEVHRGEVQEWGGDHADVGYLAPGGSQALEQRIVQAR